MSAGISLHGPYAADAKRIKSSPDFVSLLIDYPGGYLSLAAVTLADLDSLAKGIAAARRELATLPVDPE